MRLLLSVFPWLFFLVASCTSPKQFYAGGSPGYAAQAAEPDYLTESLFDYKERTLSEEAIRTILDSPIKMPDTIRIAILNYGSNSINRYYSNYWQNEEYLKLQQGYIERIREALADNGRVQKIILMPRLLTGRNPDIFQLREAAVRLQADLLFIFSVNSDIYYQYRVFKKDEAKAFATCESLLMDIRTGIVPYSEVVTRDKLVAKTEADLNDEETRKRAERETVELVMEEIANRLDQFLR